MRTELGKIKSATFGCGGYQDAQFGLSLGFGGDAWGVCAFEGTWADPPSEHAKWTETEQSACFAKCVRLLRDTLRDANKQDVSQLVGVPVEVTFNGNVIFSWRISKEVL